MKENRPMFETLCQLQPGGGEPISGWDNFLVADWFMYIVYSKISASLVWTSGVWYNFLGMAQPIKTLPNSLGSSEQVNIALHWWRLLTQHEQDEQ